ncbi:MAG: glycosyltransferase family 4 protein [Planctomycetota bacterium]|jgi:glycosyltransferase involved in cell wall biosynthesis
MSTKESNENISSSKEKKLTVYFLTNDFSGLHDMFETQNWDAIAGVPLVPLYWLKLAEKGHSVHVFVFGAFKCKKDFTLKGIHFYLRCLPKWTEGTAKGDLKSFLKIRLFLLQFKVYFAVRKICRVDFPDVIYSYFSGLVPMGHLLSRLMRVPHVVHFWGTWLAHYLFKQPWYKCIPFLGPILCFKFPIDLLIISNDGTEGDKVVEKLKFPKERFRFWLDGTAPDIYQPDIDKAEIKRSIGLLPSDKMIFQAVRLDFWKRIDRSIAAMPTVIRRVPNARLIIAGDGPLRGKLEKQAAELGVSDCVKFLGFVPHDTVLKMHNAADLFLSVQDLTNLGNQIFEAFHSGACTVAYNIGGTSHIMKDEVTGVLLEEEDLRRLGDVIADLLLDDHRRERLGRGALDFAKENIWTWDKRADVEIAEIQQLVAHHHRKQVKKTKE